MFLDMRDGVVQSLQAIWKTVGELDACMLVILEEVRESKLISVLILLILYGICIWNSASSSAPSRQLLNIAIAHLHSFIIQAWTLSKVLYYKMSLSSDTLNRKVKPCWNAIGVGLFLQFYLISVAGYQPGVPKAPALEIAFEESLADGYHSSSLALHAPYASSCLLDIQFFVRIALLED